MISSKLKHSIILLTASAALLACSDDDDANTPAPEVLEIPENISLNEPALFPEGIDFNSNNNQFYLSSITRGEVGTVDFETGTYATLITDPNFVNVAGVFVDEARNQLLAVSGNAGLSGVMESIGAVAYLGIYNLESGALIEGIDLSTLNTGDLGVFANDIALDTEGNIYVTDSFSPFIYKVERSTFEASIFLNGGEEFTPSTGNFGLNGIIFINDYLVTGHTESGILYKIPLADPQSYEAINVNRTFVGVDGLEVAANSELIVVQNGFGAENTGTYSLVSNDNWSTASVTSTDLVDAALFPTTATLASDGEIYVVNAYFSVLFAGSTDQDVFSIVKRVD